MQEKKPKMTFDDSAKEYILSLFNKKVNEDGEVLEKDSNEPVKSFEGNPLTLEDFGGVKKGSELFIENNVVSLFRLKYRKE
ncbi:MAG: hypothetical protein ACYDCP_06110 [Thermoplasmataceae archaeon]|jgi:hypothetical protein